MLASDAGGSRSEEEGEEEDDGGPVEDIGGTLYCRFCDGGKECKEEYEEE